MERLQRTEFITRRSLKYTYYVSTSGRSTEQCPTLLFLHGFPDSARLWKDVISNLSDLPNKIIIPDCLGYAGTDKPADTTLYAYQGQADDLAEILDNEDATGTIVIGHDWGSALAQRLYLHQRDRINGVVLLNVAYLVPSSEPFNLAHANDITERMTGRPRLAYWELFTASDGAEVIDRNLDRMWQALHGDVEDWMKKLFCTRGALRDFLLGSEEVPLKAYAKQPERKEAFLQQFARDGFAPALRMYKATALNVQTSSDSHIPRDKLTIGVPMLYLICTQDAVCTPETMIPAKKQGLVPDLKEVVIESAHWSPMEKPKEVAAHIRDFLTERFPPK